MNNTTEQYYNDMEDDCECTEELSVSKSGCLIFMIVCLLIAVILIVLAGK